jgi:hypothetical protein
MEDVAEHAIVLVSRSCASKDYADLLRQRLLVPTLNRPAPDEGGGAEMEIICSRNPAGERIAWVFTSSGNLERWRSNQAYFRAQGVRIFEALVAIGVVQAQVNPGSEGAFSLSADELECLATGRIPRTPPETVLPNFPNLSEAPKAPAGQAVQTFSLPGAGQVKIGPPAALPGALLRRIAAVVAAEPLVAFACLSRMEYSRGPVRTADALVLTPTPAGTAKPAEMEASAVRIGRAMEEWMPEGRAFDVMTLPADHELLGRLLRCVRLLAVNDARMHGECLGRLKGLPQP